MYGEILNAMSQLHRRRSSKRASKQKITRSSDMPIVSYRFITPAAWFFSERAPSLFFTFIFVDATRPASASQSIIGGWEKRVLSPLPVGYILGFFLVAHFPPESKPVPPSALLSKAPEGVPVG